MRFRFGHYVLDEDARELRLDGREIEVQPLVFDLLRYLIVHRDRVVTKQELLDNLWDDALVVDGALQRVVSLARTALKPGHAEQAIRTYARKGYRFCDDAIAEAGTSHGTRLDQARAAFENKDWAAAVDALAAADAESAVDGPDLERWARALQCLARTADAAQPLERAVATYALKGDRRGSARAALSMAYVLLEQRDNTAIAKGWHKRAERYLDRIAPCKEHALHAMLAGRLALAERDNERALACSNQTIELARAMGDADIEAIGLVYSGHALMALGDVSGGAARHDEAAAAVLAGEISPWYVSVIYCGVIWACRNLGDWRRATAWTEQFSRWNQARPGSRFPGTCQLHRAEVLAVGGDLPGAESEVAAALDMLRASAPWAEGDAHRIRGGLLLMRGDIDGASRAFATAIEQGWDPQPEYALLHIARNDIDLAMRGLERTITDTHWLYRERLPELLSQLVTLAVRKGDAPRARSAMSELEGLPEGLAMPAHRAAHERARAELAVLDGERKAALTSLRQTLRLWDDIGAPIKAVTTRIRIAEILLEDGDPAAALGELSAVARSTRALGLRLLSDMCDEIEAKCRSALA
ncbi:MAG TPA: winged helix-turn-helix domain-containing protein [Candidatus Krumholzibacteria bacterium]|nr:winged helix-turn-helix domain-containing protein [Candidatus Krumholzibacteria bacterium]